MKKEIIQIMIFLNFMQINFSNKAQKQNKKFSQCKKFILDTGIENNQKLDYKI